MPHNSSDMAARGQTTPSQTRATATPLAKSVSRRVEQLLADLQNHLPVWIRSPKSGVEHYSGFSRAKLYEGAARGHFRSVSIREPGQTKGTRLFHLPSLLQFIERCEAEAKEANAQRSGDGGDTYGV